MSELEPMVSTPEYQIPIEIDTESDLSIPEILGSKDQIMYEAPGVGSKDRYEYYIVATAEGKEAFVKETTDPEKKECLAFEASATIVAKKIGIPCTSVFDSNKEGSKPYIEKGEKGALALEVIDSEKWSFLPTKELLASLSPEQSERLISSASKIMVNHLGTEIPDNIDTRSLRQGETATPRYRSPESVQEQWEIARQLIADNIADVFPIDTEQNKQRISGLISDGENRLKHLVETMGSKDKKYFTHGDFNTSNMCIANNDNPDDEGLLVIDFEQSGATNHQALAKVNDLYNCFGTLWQQPKLQESLIKSYFKEATKTSSIDQCYNLIRTSVIFGTTDYARYGMAHNHPEHDMSVTLLNNLQTNLNILENEYKDKLNATK